MKKKFISRCLLGAVIGIAIGYLITIMISLDRSDSYYFSCAPGLISLMGSEINAVILQAFLFGVLGAGFTASNVIWQIDSWSVVKQTGIYFLVTSFIMMPIAYFSYWMEHSIIGFLIYFGIFAFIFIIVWIIQFAIGKYNVKKLNEKLSMMKDYKNK